MENLTILKTNPQFLEVSKLDTTSFAKNLFQIFGATCFLAVSAQIAIPLSPVPLTMQTLAAMMVGLTLGKTKGSLAYALYLLQAAVGLPVLSGMATFASPLVFARYGYILGMAAQVYLVGALFEKYSKSSFSTLFLSVALISFLQLQLGVLWLGSFIGWSQALTLGFYPFIPGEVLKCMTLLCYAKKES